MHRPEFANLRRTSIAVLLITLAASTVPVSGAIGVNGSPDPGAVVYEGSEVFDPSSVEWRDDITGKRIKAPTPAKSVPGGANMSVLAADAAYPSACNGSNYRVIYQQDYEDFYRSNCYSGYGSYYVSGYVIGMTFKVIGVCPRAVGGQIRYRTYSGNHWATLRSASSSSKCYYFRDSGFEPDSYDIVKLNM